MSVEQVVTILIGPAGIWFGWFLNQRSMRSGADRAARMAEQAEERERVIQTVRLARSASGQLRSVMHAMYLKGTGTKPVGFHEAIDELNRAVDEFRDSALAMRVLGPSWAVAGAERINVEMTKLMELSHLMQNLTSAHVDSANRALPEFDQLLSDYVLEVSKHYISDTRALPTPPDLEKEGRWQAIGVESTG
jgi:hypothetical protein